MAHCQEIACPHRLLEGEYNSKTQRGARRGRWRNRRGYQIIRTTGEIVRLQIRQDRASRRSDTDKRSKDCDDRDTGALECGRRRRRGRDCLMMEVHKVRERRSRTLTKLRKDKTAREFSLPLSDRFSLFLSLSIFCSKAVRSPITNFLLCTRAKLERRKTYSEQKRRIR